MNNCPCGKPIKTEEDARRGCCFACHIKGVRFGFVGGREAFSSGPTIREQQRYYEDSDAFKQGKIEKVPARAELI